MRLVAAITMAGLLAACGSRHEPSVFTDAAAGPDVVAADATPDSPFEWARR